MTFRAEAGRIRVTDVDGSMILDTDERLFTATDYITGSITTPARSGSQTLLVDHVLASCNAAADVVVGAFEVVVGNGVLGLGWFNAGGTYVHNMGMEIGITDGTNRDCIYLHAFTFRAASGQLLLTENLALENRGAVFYAPVATTFNYKLYCGSFV